jgi:PAS domain S-box-containing protein
MISPSACKAGPVKATKSNRMVSVAMKSFFRTLPVRIILPVGLTIVLFVATIFFLIIPMLESNMMNGKRQMIAQLTETAISALGAFQRQAAEGRISVKEAQRQAIEHIRQWRYGVDGKDYFWINDLNPRMIMHPYRSDLEGKDISDFTDPNGKRLFIEAVAIVKAGGAGYMDYAWQWMDEPDHIVPKISFVKQFKPWGWIIGTGVYIEDVHAEMAAITRDLTWVCLAILALIMALSFDILRTSIRQEKERHQAQEALRKSEEKYRLLAETARDFIIAFDLKGTIQYANSAWLAAGGHDARQMAQMKLVDLVPASLRDALEAHLAQVLDRHETPHLFETEFLAGRQGRLPVEVSTALIKEQDHPVGMLLIARDITEKRVSQKQARIQQEQLFQASKLASLGTLVSGVAHEINNPISAIMLNAPLLANAWHEMLPILDEYCRAKGDFSVGKIPFSLLRSRIPALLADMAEGARRVKNIVGDLKDFARLPSPEMSDTVDINGVVKKAVGLVENLIRKTTHHFSADYGDGLPPIRGNRQRLEQVVVNLLVNACQSLPDRQGTVRLSTRHDPQAGTIEIEVCDTGIGMSEELLGRIKDPFFTTKRESGGTGLGLSISDQIVETHGGSIHFRSAPQKGTSALVVLPARETDP